MSGGLCSVNPIQPPPNGNLTSTLTYQLKQRYTETSSPPNTEDILLALADFIAVIYTIKSSYFNEGNSLRDIDQGQSSHFENDKSKGHRDEITAHSYPKDYFIPGTCKSRKKLVVLQAGLSGGLLSYAILIDENIIFSVQFYYFSNHNVSVTNVYKLKHKSKSKIY